ncbi:hypothetical protein D3C87_1879650 [compost metagenome]
MYIAIPENNTKKTPIETYILINDFNFAHSFFTRNSVHTGQMACSNAEYIKPTMPNSFAIIKYRAILLADIF